MIMFCLTLIIAFWVRFEMNEIEKKAKDFTDYLYDAYGSGYGVLFGIPSNCRDAVQTIVKLVMEKNEKRKYAKRIF